MKKNSKFSVLPSLAENFLPLPPLFVIMEFTGGPPLEQVSGYFAF